MDMPITAPESKKPAYLAGLVARFFFALGVNGAGGVASIRRSTSSVLGGGASRFGLVAVVMAGV